MLHSAPPPAQGIATGKYHAAVLTNSAEWEAACVKAGRRCGDLVHPLVYCPELHFSEFTSAVADMKNSVAVGVQGAQGTQDVAAVGPQIHTQQGSIQSGDVALSGLPRNGSIVLGTGGPRSKLCSFATPASRQGEGRPLKPHARSSGSLCAISQHWGTPNSRGLFLQPLGEVVSGEWVVEGAQGCPLRSKREQPQMPLPHAPAAGSRKVTLCPAVPPGPGQQPQLLRRPFHRLTHRL